MVIDRMISFMFKNVYQSITDIIDTIGTKTDPFYHINLSIIVQKFFKKYTNSNFINSLLKETSLKCNSLLSKFITKEIDSIKIYTCDIKKINITPFIAKFEYFIDKIDKVSKEFVIVNKNSSSVDHCILPIIVFIFETIDKLAKQNEKHASPFKLKNYAYFFKSFQTKNYPYVELKKQIEKIKSLYDKIKIEYINWCILSKFDEIFKFFEGVEEFLTTVDSEDITFQTQYSKSQLQIILKKYGPQTEKHIEYIYYRLEKHLGPKGEDEKFNIFKEIWDELSSFLVKSYKKFEELAKKCYVNINISPNYSDLEEMISKMNKKPLDNRKSIIF
jgi:hypothetical protein